jgi:hypothetical protein
VRVWFWRVARLLARGHSSPRGTFFEMEQQHKVPCYVLVSSSSRARTTAVASSAAPILGHPVLQYHYANDSPLSLLPRSNDEQVLVLDYDPLSPALTRAQSISGSSAVTGIKVTDAPGAGSAEGDGIWSNKMFVLETTTFDSRFVYALGSMIFRLNKYIF